MCEANVYLRKAGKEELFMAQVDKVVPLAEQLMLQDVFGEKAYINAHIAEMALVEHKIILQEN